LKVFDNIPCSPLRIIKHILNYTYRPFLEWYLQKDRAFKFGGISIVVKTGVFHPGFFFSTRFLLEELKQQELKNKRLLELGCGSGLISVVAAKNGANVTASDINRLAISCALDNAQLNGVQILTFQSDVFSNIPAQLFDYIIINPPYYRGEAINEAQKAWYAGNKLEYFEKLFQQIGSFIKPETLTLMVLSEDCEIDGIMKIAKSNSLALLLRRTKKFWFERNYIYEITGV
jgi:release factor glutamine methyltransferase